MKKILSLSKIRNKQSWTTRIATTWRNQEYFLQEAGLRKLVLENYFFEALGVFMSLKGQRGIQKSSISPKRKAE